MNLYACAKAEPGGEIENKKLHITTKQTREKEKKT